MRSALSIFLLALAMVAACHESTAPGRRGEARAAAQHADIALDSTAVTDTTGPCLTGHTVGNGVCGP